MDGVLGDDGLEEGHSIAITSGSHHDADNWYMYYFLGRRLQNRLHYVPISTSGNFIAFGSDGERRRSGDYAAWVDRLASDGVSYVVSFQPRSVELDWMESRPQLFERLEGAPRAWGLFRTREALVAREIDDPRRGLADAALDHSMQAR